MLTRGDKVGVAVSAGADSVVLLHVLHRLISTLAIHLTILHVNHGLRGAESDADEQFVRELARTLGLAFISTLAVPGPGNLEQEARILRKAFFSDCRRNCSLHRIALGHTKSDQAETVLYRFLRGSGTAGLAGMRPVTEDGFIRPLLRCTRAEVRAWAVAQGIQWREDSSNSDPGFARNLLRNQLIPQLTADFNRNLEGVLAGTAEVAAGEEDYWRAEIAPLYKELVKKCHLGLVLDIKRLSGMHIAVQRRLIRLAFADLRKSLRSIELQHVDRILELCTTDEGHDRVLIPGVDAIRSFAVLLLTEPGRFSAESRNYSVEIMPGIRVELPFGAGTVELSVINANDQSCVNFKKESQFPIEIADLDYEALTSRFPAARLQVRNWRPGDGMLRPGHQKPEKIKSLFQESRILLWKRRHWPMGVVNDEVFWARHFGAAKFYAANPQTSHIVRLCYRSSDEIPGT
jgi:tRNA(Ile)-lysidine synthase